MKKTLLIFCVSIAIFSCSEDEGFVSPQEQLEKDIVTIDRYLADNNITALEHESGLRYVVDVEGTGSSAKITDIVRVNYEGRLMSNEQVFDANDDIEFPLANVISGWQIGIPLFPEGGSGTLYIPSGYAYGRNGQGSSIPGNAILIFDIDVLEVK